MIVNGPSMNKDKREESEDHYRATTGHFTITCFKLLMCLPLSWLLLAFLPVVFPQQPVSNRRIIGWQRRSVYCIRFHYFKVHWTQSLWIRFVQVRRERFTSTGWYTECKKDPTCIQACTKGFFCATQEIFSEVIRAERLRCLSWYKLKTACRLGVSSLLNDILESNLNCFRVKFSFSQARDLT